jgi:hypothetical protein
VTHYPIEFVSGSGKEERDYTSPHEGEKAGKFWVYEQVIGIPFYVIFEVSKALYRGLSPSRSQVYKNAT